MIVHERAELSALELVFEVRSLASPFSAGEENEDDFILCGRSFRCLFDRAPEPNRLSQ